MTSPSDIQPPADALHAHLQDVASRVSAEMSARAELRALAEEARDATIAVSEAKRRNSPTLVQFALAEAHAYAALADATGPTPILAILDENARLREERDSAQRVGFESALECSRLRSELSDALARLDKLNAAYFAASFDDEQAPREVVLKFAFGADTKVSADFLSTLDGAAVRSPSGAPDA